MVIKIYISNQSGSSKMRKEQTKIMDTLQSKGIEFEKVDISDPVKDEEKKFMRANASALPGQNVPLPPQIFCDEEYLGDYEAFFNSVEDNQIEEFLRIKSPTKTSQAQITVTGGQGPSE